MQDLKREGESAPMFENLSGLGVVWFLVTMTPRFLLVWSVTGLHVRDN